MSFRDALNSNSCETTDRREIPLLFSLLSYQNANRISYPRDCHLLEHPLIAAPLEIIDRPIVVGVSGSHCVKFRNFLQGGNLEMQL